MNAVPGMNSMRAMEHTVEHTAEHMVEATAGQGGKRILSLWLPQWPTDRLYRTWQRAPKADSQAAAAQDLGKGPKRGQPLALVAAQQGGQRVGATNMAAAEAGGPGRWTQLSAAPLEPCPQVVDVDFPAVGLTQAEWVDGELRLRVTPLDEDPTEWTTFRIVGAPSGVRKVTAPEGTTVQQEETGTTVRMRRVHADVRLRLTSG